jgi:hypothetical protein
MRLKALALAVLVAGFGSSYALAKGKPPKGGDSTTTAETTTSASAAKVTLCHKAGKSGRWVKITVSARAAEKRLKKGDVLPDAGGNCPKPA